MYIDDLKGDFYEYLTDKRIFLIVNYDIDSICTCKIFQSIVKYRHILYSLAVVRTLNELKIAFQENCNDVKNFLLINCGGTIDIVDILEPDDDIIFFILDSHKPTDLCNIYSNGQVRLLTKSEDDVQVPEFRDIFDMSEDEDDDEEEIDEDGALDVATDGSNEEGHVRKRRRLDEDQLEKRRLKRLWMENRNKLLFEYTQFTYYAKASALLMFDLAWKVNRDDVELLWLAIIGLTEQLIFGKIENNDYVLAIDGLQAHTSRLNNRTTDKSISSLFKIQFENDLKIVLHRHWSVEESLKFSPYTAAKLKFWSHRGEKKLQELLADMGFPLIQSRQAFKSMDLQLRKEFNEKLEKLSDKYLLDEISFASFTIQSGYRTKYSASDTVYILLAILEYSTENCNSEELFNLALDCLNRSKKEIINNFLEKSKKIMKILFKTVQWAIDMKQILNAGPFLYFILQDDTPDSRLISQQHILLLLTNFLLKAYCSVSRNRRCPNLPLIVSTPNSNIQGDCLILGIPPLNENSPKNFFGKAFEQAAEKIGCESTNIFFDTSYFSISIKDRTRFFDAITTLLT